MDEEVDLLKLYIGEMLFELVSEQNSRDRENIKKIEMEVLEQHTSLVKYQISASSLDSEYWLLTIIDI